MSPCLVVLFVIVSSVDVAFAPPGAGVITGLITMWYSGYFCRSASILAAPTRHSQLLPAAKPGLGAAAPLLRHAERGVRREEVCVRIVVVRTVIEDVGVAVYELADIDVVLCLELAGISASLTDGDAATHAGPS